MKAIYINLDPYLAAFAAWIKGGKVGDAPKFAPLPLAVTLPLGESAAIYLEKAWVAEDEDYGPDVLTIDGTTVGVSATIAGEGDALARDVVPGISALAPAAKYAVLPVTGDASVLVYINDGESDVGEIRITVLVRREQSSGPVDLVDFTPPPDMRGVSLAGAIIQATGDEATATLYNGGGDTNAYPLGVDSPSNLAYALGGTSAS